MSDIQRKTIYTAYSRSLTIVVNILSQFILTPLILSFLGSTLYGIYILVNKTNNYLSVVDIRPTAILRLKLSYEQSNQNLDEKQKYIGASYIISLIFTPVFIIGGIVFAVFFPKLFNIQPEYADISRIAIVCLAIFLAINGFLGIPEAILRGNNLEFKGFYIEPLRQILIAGLTILFLWFGWGLLGVIFSMFIASVTSYILRKKLQKKYLPEYSSRKPKSTHIRLFFHKGSWYLLSSFLTQLIDNFDVLIIGFMFGPKYVTLFAITKAIIFRLIEAVTTLVTSASSGIGEIVGSQDMFKLACIRKNLLLIVIPISLFIASYFIIFNGYFISLWTGPEVYAGFNTNLIICVSAIFLMLTSTEELFILSFLDFKKKTIYLGLSAISAIFVSVIMGNLWGLAGNALGILTGRMVLYFLYRFENNKKIGIKFRLPLSMTIKNIFFIIIAGFLFIIIRHYYQHSIFTFIAFSIIFLIIAIPISYFLLLPHEYRTKAVIAINNVTNKLKHG